MSVQVADAVTWKVYVPAGMKLVPLVAPLPLSKSMKFASLGDEETSNKLSPN